MHHSGYTRREYRRLGISTFCRTLLLAKARERGCQRVIVAIAGWNWPSLNSCKYRSQLQPLGSVVRWGFGPFTKLWTTGDVAINDQNELYSKMCHVVLPKNSN